jgi:hypothetical protein
VDKIDEFQGSHRFLSNFWKDPFVIDGFVYSTNEHYYQSMKGGTRSDRKYVREAPTPYQAKKRGRSIKVRSGWDDMKVDVMRRGLRAKFTQNESLKKKLLDTGDAILEEGNDWGDSFWGINKNPKKGMLGGKNHLGKLLMELRDDLRSGLEP